MKTQKIKPIDNEEQRAIARHDNNRETVTTLASAINQAFEEFNSSTKEIYDLALSVENRRIRLGTLLHTAKAQLPHGQFTPFIEANCRFSERTARRFVQHAELAGFKELESIDDLKVYNNLLVSWGLKEPAEGHGPQVLHDSPNYFIQTTKNLGAVRRSLTDLLEARPVADWDESEKSQLKEQLAPVVAIYEKL